MRERREKIDANPRQREKEQERRMCKEQERGKTQ